MLRKSLIAIALAGSLAGCGTPLGNVVGAITGSSVPSQAVGVAINAWTGLEGVGVAYMGYCRLGTSVPPDGRICSKQIINQVATDIRIGHKQARALISLLQANPGAGIPVASYNTFKTEIDTLQAIIQQYNLALPGTALPAPVPAAS